MSAVARLEDFLSCSSCDEAGANPFELDLISSSVLLLCSVSVSADSERRPPLECLLKCEAIPPVEPPLCLEGVILRFKSATLVAAPSILFKRQHANAFVGEDSRCGESLDQWILGRSQAYSFLHLSSDLGMFLSQKTKDTGGTLGNYPAATETYPLSKLWSHYLAWT